MSAGATLTTAVAVVGGISSLVVALAALKDKPGVRWLVQRLVVMPVDEAFERKVDVRVEARLAPIAAQVEAIYHEVHPNSSLSMRDAIDRTENRLAVVDKRLTGVAETAEETTQRLARLEGQVDILARRDP